MCCYAWHAIPFPFKLISIFNTATNKLTGHLIGYPCRSSKQIVTKTHKHDNFLKENKESDYCLAHTAAPDYHKNFAQGGLS